MNVNTTRPTTFGKDQTTYQWNGTRFCVHCHQITRKGSCPIGCGIFIGTWGQFQADRETAHDTLRLLLVGRLSCNQCGRLINDQAPSFTVEKPETGPNRVYCESCSDQRVEERIEAGQLKIGKDGTVYDPQLFPNEEQGIDFSEPGRGTVQQALDEIEAALAAGEAFQCAYCGITDDINQLDTSRPGVNRCLTCADKHEAATRTSGRYTPDLDQPSNIAGYSEGDLQRRAEEINDRYDSDY